MNRPWVTPDDVLEYTDFKSVKSRDTSKLTRDISRAEKYIISFTNNNFAEYETVPQSVQTAVILVAEAFAFNSSLDAQNSNEMKSEQFDDYSYTRADVEKIDIDSIDLATLLEDFVKNKTKDGIVMRMRKL